MAGIANAKVTAHTIDNTAGTCIGGHKGCTTAITDAKGYWKVTCTGGRPCLGFYETENAPGFIDSSKQPEGPAGSSAWGVNTIVWNGPSSVICGPFIFYDTVTAQYQCRGLRTLVYKDSAWQDLTTEEKSNLASEKVIRFALPTTVNSYAVSKAAFKVTFDGTTEIEQETTDTMVIGGVSYYYVETTTKLSSGQTSSDYNITGWLYINGGWH